MGPPEGTAPGNRPIPPPRCRAAGPAGLEVPTRKRFPQPPPPPPPPPPRNAAGPLVSAQRARQGWRFRRAQHSKPFNRGGGACVGGALGRAGAARRMCPSALRLLSPPVRRDRLGHRRARHPRSLGAAGPGPRLIHQPRCRKQTGPENRARPAGRRGGRGGGGGSCNRSPAPSESFGDQARTVSASSGTGCGPQGVAHSPGTNPHPPPRGPRPPASEKMSVHGSKRNAPLRPARGGRRRLRATCYCGWCPPRRIAVSVIMYSRTLSSSIRASRCRSSACASSVFRSSSNAASRWSSAFRCRCSSSERAS